MMRTEEGLLRRGVRGQEHGRSVFEQAVQGGATLQAEEALRQIEPVFDEVQALEKNIGELAALFTELAMLVNAQGEVRPHDSC